jgi:hypothetical protein
MPADPRARRSAILWRAVCRVGRVLRSIHGEQAWEAWAQIGQAPWPETGPLTWVRTLDGYQLAGSHLPAGSGLTTGGIP